MALPNEELLPIHDVATDLKRSPEYVRMHLRQRRFPRVIVEKKTSIGHRWTAEYYFDATLWPFTKEEERAIKNSDHKVLARRRVTKDLSDKEYEVLDSDQNGPTIVRNVSGGHYFYLLDATDIQNERWLEDAEAVYIPLSSLNAYKHRDRLSLSKVAPVAQGHEPGDKKTVERREWEKNARTIAEEILNQRANKKLSREQLAEKVRQEMARQHENGVRGMTGRGERLLSAASILRHALKGIQRMN